VLNGGVNSRKIDDEGKVEVERGRPEVERRGMLRNHEREQKYAYMLSTGPILVIPVVEKGPASMRIGKLAQNLHRSKRKDSRLVR